MGGNSLEFSITPDRGNAKTLKFASQMSKRIAAWKRGVVRKVAENLLEAILQRLPKTDDYRAYRSSLIAGEVPADKKNPFFVVFAPNKSRKIKTIDAPRTMIYVRSKQGRKNPASDKIKFLEDNGPWTTDTIPFWPSKKEAVVIQRKVSKRETDRLGTEQDKKKAKLRTEMQRLGIRQTKRKPESKQPKRKKAIPDIYTLALQLEMGSDGIKPVPAWRISLREVSSKGKLLRMFMTDSRLFKMLSDPDNTSWVREPKQLKRVPTSMASSFVDFQKQLGY